MLQKQVMMIWTELAKDGFNKLGILWTSEAEHMGVIILKCAVWAKENVNIPVYGSITFENKKDT